VSELPAEPPGHAPPDKLSADSRIKKKDPNLTMAIKKSDLYSSLWASCDELRGGMDASQYKDYVLFMLFIKYVSGKYGNSADFAPSVTIPKGASFKDMLDLRGKSDIGDKINT